MPLTQTSAEVGLHDFEKTSNCGYLDWYCNCDMIYDVICEVIGNDHFYSVILNFIEKHVTVIMVLFLQENKDVF